MAPRESLNSLISPDTAQICQHISSETLLSPAVGDSAPAHSNAIPAPVTVLPNQGPALINQAVFASPSGHYVHYVPHFVPVMSQGGAWFYQPMHFAQLPIAFDRAPGCSEGLVAAFPPLMMSSPVMYNPYASTFDTGIVQNSSTQVNNEELAAGSAPPSGTHNLDNLPSVNGADLSGVGAAPVAPYADQSRTGNLQVAMPHSATPPLAPLVSGPADPRPPTAVYPDGHFITVNQHQPNFASLTGVLPDSTPTLRSEPLAAQPSMNYGFALAATSLDGTIPLTTGLFFLPQPRNDGTSPHLHDRNPPVQGAIVEQRVSHTVERDAIATPSYDGLHDFANSEDSNDLSSTESDFAESDAESEFTDSDIADDSDYNSGSEDEPGAEGEPSQGYTRQPHALLDDAEEDDSDACDYTTDEEEEEEVEEDSDDDAEQEPLLTGFTGRLHDMLVESDLIHMDLDELTLDIGCVDEALEVGGESYVEGDDTIDLQELPISHVADNQGYFEEGNWRDSDEVISRAALRTNTGPGSDPALKYLYLLTCHWSRQRKLTEEGWENRYLQKLACQAEAQLQALLDNMPHLADLQGAMEDAGTSVKDLLAIRTVLLFHEDQARVNGTPLYSELILEVIPLLRDFYSKLSEDAVIAINGWLMDFKEELEEGWCFKTCLGSRSECLMFYEEELVRLQNAVDGTTLSMYIR